MHPSTDFLNEVCLCLYHFPRNVFLATKDELLISTFREHPGVFLLLDISVASDIVVLCGSGFSGSNLSSSTATFRICKSTLHRDSVFLSYHSVPLRN